MKFSRNGRYLATAGQDMVIRVWEVILNRGDMNPSGSVQSDGYIPPDQGELPLPSCCWVATYILTLYITFSCNTLPLIFVLHPGLPRRVVFRGPHVRRVCMRTEHSALMRHRVFSCLLVCLHRQGDHLVHHALLPMCWVRRTSLNAMSVAQRVT